MSKGENFIHLKFEHEEAVQSKRIVLSSELDLINVMQSLRDYIALRKEEQKVKAKFYREIKKVTANIKLLEKALPVVEIPKILKHHATKPVQKQEETEPAVEVKNANKKENALQSQLAEIQRKLKALSG